MNTESRPGIGDDDATATHRVHREQTNDHEREGTGGGFDRDRAEREARDAIGSARDELQALLENQKNAAADRVRDVARALRSTGDELRAKDQHTVAAYVASVADRIEHWSGQLHRRHIDMLARDIQQFATRQPLLCIAGAAVIGFAATRFLKSSESRPSHDSDAHSPSGETAALTPAVTAADSYNP